MKEPSISSAVFKYNGDTEAFEQFMKALISEYLVKDSGCAFEIEVTSSDDRETIVIRSA